MSIPFQNSATVARPSTLEPAPSFARQLKDFCLRILTPGAESLTATSTLGREHPCLARADELSRELADRYTLYVGCESEGLLVANLLANRYGACLAELQAFCDGTVWMSRQVKVLSTHARILVILPLAPQFSDAQRQCLDRALASSTAHATSIAPGAPILPIATVSALSSGPSRPSNR